MTDGGFYAMYNSGVVEETGFGNQGWRAPEYGTVAPNRVWVDGPPQLGDVDTNGNAPKRENMLRALYLPRFPSEDVLFVEPNKLSSLKVTMEEWLTIPGYYNGKKISDLAEDWKEVFGINQLLNTDVSDLAQKMSNEQLQGFVSASGKTNPVIKNLYKRLHHDLKYPLSNKQASMIRVDPWPVKGGQLCAARQRLAFAQLTELDFDTLTAAGKKYKSLTQAGGPLAQNLHSAVIRSEGRSKMPDEIASLSHGEQPSAAATGPAAAAEPDLGPPPLPPFKPPISAPEPAQAQPPTARYVSVFEDDSSDSDQDGGGRKKTKRRKKTRKRKTRKKSKRKTRKKRKKSKRK
jgi:hypothetical protein